MVSGVSAHGIRGLGVARVLPTSSERAAEAAWRRRVNPEAAGLHERCKNLALSGGRVQQKRVCVGSLVDPIERRGQRMEGKKREGLRKRDAPAGASPEKGQKRGRKAEVGAEEGGGGGGGSQEGEPRGSNQGGAVACRTRSSQAALSTASASSSAEKKGKDKKEGGATNKYHPSASQNQ